MNKVMGKFLYGWQHYGYAAKPDSPNPGPWMDCEFIASNHRYARVLFEGLDGGVSEQNVPLKFVSMADVAGDTEKFSNTMVALGLWNSELTDMRVHSQQTMTTVQRAASVLDLNESDLGEDMSVTWPDFHLDTDGIMPGTFTPEPELEVSKPAPVDESYRVGHVTMPFKPTNTAGMMLLLAMENSPEVRIKKLVEHLEKKIHDAAAEGHTKVKVGPFDMSDFPLVGEMNGACDKLMGDGFLIMIDRVKSGEFEAELEIRWDPASIKSAQLEWSQGRRSCMQPWSN